MKRGPSLIVVDNLGVALNQVPVLHEIGFAVRKKEIFTLVGPNGSGKSTLLRAIAGLVAYSGDLRVDSRSPHLGLVAHVPQRPELPQGMNVAEYALLGRNPHLSWFESEGEHDRRIVNDILSQLDLYEYAGRLVTELSGGEMQRVVMARALAQQASILLLDEPTSALDLKHQIEVMRLINSLRRQHELTIVLALHDLTLAARYSDRVMLLDSGRATAIGSPREVFNEEALSALYGTPIRVLNDSDGHMIVTHGV